MIVENIPQKLKELQDALKVLELENKKLREFIREQGMEPNFHEFLKQYSETEIPVTVAGVRERYLSEGTLHPEAEAQQMEQTEVKQPKKVHCPVCR